MCSASLPRKNPVSTAFGASGLRKTRIIKGLGPTNGRVSGVSPVFNVRIHFFRNATAFIRGVGLGNKGCRIDNCLRCNTYGSRGYLPPAGMRFSFGKRTTKGRATRRTITAARSLVLTSATSISLIPLHVNRSATTNRTTSC